MKSITAEVLSTLLGSDKLPRLLDVRLAEDFEASHLPGALNNCVFEVVFHERLTQQLPDKTQAVILYGANARSQEAVIAGEKLERDGYTDVTLLKGGLASWQVGRYPLELGKALPAPPEPLEGPHPVEPAECRIQWMGRNLLTRHFGTVDITTGQLEFDDGNLTGGEIAFDLRTMKCVNLDGTPDHDVLIGHLLSHDFLDAGRYPEGKLVIRHAERLDRHAGTPNLDLRAELTLRGVAMPIEFQAVSGRTPDGRAAAQASFTIDRTRWGILYGSGRFFHHLGKHLVNDLVEFQVKIVCQ